jgi:hypothetical protein
MAVVAAICIGTLSTIAQADPAGKWRVEFGDRPDYDGVLTLRVSPEGGTPVDVETDDGEDVVVKKTGKTPKFELTLAASTLTGLQIKVKHE